MFPDLFTVGSVTFHSYGLFVAAGFAFGLVLTLKVGRFMGIGPDRVLNMAVYLILSAIAGSRLMVVMMHMEDFKGHFPAVFNIWQGRLSFAGGMIAVIATLFFYAKMNRLSFWEMGDLWAPAAALGQAVGRIGCFLAGCCFGKPTSSPVSIIFTDPRAIAPLHTPLYPTQLLAAAGGVGITVVLLLIHKTRKFEGQVLLWYLILYSTVTLFIEKYRGDDRAFLWGRSMSATQGVCVGMLVWAVIMLFLLKSRKKPPAEVQK